MKRIILAALVGMLVSGPAYAEGWLCIANAVTGFKYDEPTKKWKSSYFKVGNKYLIKRPDPKYLWLFEEQSGSIWVVNEFGRGLPSWFCPEEIDKIGWLTCDAWGGDFPFNKKALRFMRLYLAGYLDGGTPKYPDTKHSDTPYMEIGTCTPL